jgi:membrane-associated phospholipid phosphatase
MSNRSMRIEYAVWAPLFAIAVLSAWAASRYAYFPGDVTAERWVQSLFPHDLTWAQDISMSAEFPWLLVIVAVVFAFSWVLAGWRIALLSVLSLAGMLALGLWLGPVVGRPRPSPDLVRVEKRLSGYSFPSLFALRCAATLGFLAVLAAWKGAGRTRVAIPVVCAALLVLGWFARIALAAHWPSDVLISYYLGVLWAAFLIRIGHGGPAAGKNG